jgi:hypothetical protein
MFCGAPAAVRRRKTFSSTEWLTTTKMILRVPACARHANYWLRQAAILVLTFTGLCGLGVAANLVLEVVGNAFGRLAVFAWAVCLLGWVIFLGVYVSAGVRSTEVTDRWIRLTGVHPAFIEALDAERTTDPQERFEFGDERDDYDELRPPRRRTSEDIDYLPRRRRLTADEPDDRPWRRDEHHD